MTGKKPTGRTKQLSLKATPQFHQRLKVLASKDKCLMIEILEQGLKLYEQVRKERKKSINTKNISSKENIQPKVSPEPIRSKRSRDDMEESSDTSSKKRKISDY
jgi:hypothetical protein